MSTPPQLFDRRARAQRRDRAWRAGLFSEAAYLHDEAISTMIDRLSVVTRAFPDAALFGAADGRYRAAFEGRFGIERLRAFETAPAMARACGAEAGDLDPTPLLESSADLIVAGLELHTIDDPVGALIQARRALRPDGLFIGCLFGGDSLWELREALTAAEAEVSGGLRPRVAPMTDIRSAGALLPQAVAAEQTADEQPVRPQRPTR
ncbi:MAG: methyltransferase domain-containing protein, partial [Pseudomonadota bacterium]